MTFRILTNGSQFKVQVRKLFHWQDIKKPWSCSEYCGHSTRFFNSRKKALHFIIHEYGHSSTMQQDWVLSTGDVLKEIKSLDSND